ncbi:MAG: hypothetical protein HQL91_08720 [Magnetococcales bacterium]|nr:hypothetical protein [Magnetococcales bacterium]
MNIWNLLVVVCFIALYLAVSLVFIQVQKLRDELKASRAEPDVEPVDAAECVNTIRREIANLEERLESAVRAIPEQIHKDLQKEMQGIQNDLRYLSRPGPVGMNMGGVVGHGSKLSENGSPVNMADAYREARLLLANGVDEDRVVNETGLAVEEVSLLKRLHRSQLEERDP